MPESKSQHVVDLATDLLDDVELSRLTPEALLLKASRLARLAGSAEEQEWINLELSGYNSSSKVSKKYLARTGRWVDREKGTAYWGPLAEQEAALDASKLSLDSLSTQGIGGEHSLAAVRQITGEVASLTNHISKLGGIRSRVLGLLHTFVSRVYYERLFSQAASTIFERYQESVDKELAHIAGDVLVKLPVVYDRLTEGEDEAISQAMNTLRRTIDAFADAVCPATDEALDVEGKEVSLGRQQHQNRINTYVASKISSSTRKKRLRQALSNIYNRVCAGVHSDVSPSEAQALVLSTYLLLGECISEPGG